MKQLMAVLRSPFVPIHWGKNQAGMIAQQELQGLRRWICIKLWASLRYPALLAVWIMIKCGLHKQIANRLIEPWSWITVIATANRLGWENLFKLRCHPDAEPHFQKIAFMMMDAYVAHTPDIVKEGDWHLPLVDDTDKAKFVNATLAQIATGRCARVSYLTHDGRRSVHEDILLHDRLSVNGHWSPFEHCCEFKEGSRNGGNLGKHVIQYRKTFAMEYGS
jgi:hypothetical protein